MRLATSDASTYKKDDTTRVAYDLLKEGFGPGFNAPLLLAVELPKAGDQASLQKISDALSKQDGIARGAAAAAQRGRRHGDDDRLPDDHAAGRAHRRDRQDRTRRDPAAGRGGRPARASRSAARRPATSTSRKTIRDKLPLFIGVVVGLSLLLLAVVFRSILIPVKAGIFNLLSIAGAFGVVTLIFQDGHVAGLFGGATGPIESFLPIMVFAVVFGLSMDYEVFLVSPHARGVDAHQGRPATRCSTAWR